MPSKQEYLVRLALAISERLKTVPLHRQNAVLPVDAWQRCESVARQSCRARQHGWHLAADRLQRELACLVGRLHGDLNEVESMLGSSDGERSIATTADIYADLITLDDEFEDVSFDSRAQTLSVTTEPIELEGIYLGPFEICLDWSELAHSHSHNYHVVALAPHSAATNESVTHPHVQNEDVCEGEGRLPIRMALEQGRLLDFFVIVANLLRTYNSGSPYVSLADWYGIACTDCGTTVSDDELWMCDKCEASICGECGITCPGCGAAFCTECVTCCEECDQSHCRGCMKECSECGAQTCQDCLNDEERCANCHEKEHEEAIEEPVAPTQLDRERALTSAEPDRVGEAAIPA